jgi:hypothetical protein
MLFRTRYGSDDDPWIACHRVERRAAEASMKSPASEHVTLVEILELTRPFDEFESVTRAVARRLELEGIAALVTFQVYAEP